MVAIPFPTGLLGDRLLTNQAAPAVVLYNATLALVAIGWILVAGAAVRDHLTSDPRATVTMGASGRNGYFAFALYALLAILALWFPVPVAIVTTLSWLFWLVFGIRMKRVSVRG